MLVGTSTRDRTSAPRTLIPVAPAAETPPQPVPPKAWILVDADTGDVLDGANFHVPMRPASVTKVLTALAVVEALTPDATIPVSARAEGMPAAKINMKAGEMWPFEDAFHSMLLSSANDAAVALAERADGTLEAFSQHLRAVASEIGLQDSPTLNDPAGLDDATFSFDGGNLISARDLAIAARTALANPEIAAAVANPVYTFVGPDGAHHRLGNHNQLLKRYPGAIGVKTGYTKQAGNTYIGAAQRDGRTMIVVMMGAPEIYATAGAYLDKGFATPVASETATEQLPALHRVSYRPSPPPVPEVRTVGPASDSRPLAAVPAHHDRDWTEPIALALAGVLGGLGLLRVRARRRSRRRAYQRIAPAPFD